MNENPSKLQKLEAKINNMEGQIKNLKWDNMAMKKIIDAHGIKVNRGCSCYQDDCGCFDQAIEESVKKFFTIKGQ